MLYSEAIKLILESLGRKDEVEYYLKRFRSQDSSYFSILVPDYETLDQFWGAFLVPLEILYKLELLPIVFIGGPDYQKYIEQFSLIDFFKVLVLERENQIFKEKYKKIPVIFVNEIFIKFYNKYYHILPQRILFIRNAGNLKDLNYQNIFQIHPYENTLKNKDLKILFDDFGIYYYASSLYNQYNNLQISITSSFFLLKELFTIKGAGTLLRKKIKIQHIKKDHITESLKTYLKEKIELNFAKKLKDSALDEITDIIMDDSYQSFIILEQKEFAYYLSKFVVSIEARGKGIAMDLWEYVDSLNIPVFWKTKKTNSIHKWYEKISDGLIRQGNYIIFWKNLSYMEIPKMMDFILKRGTDFYGEEF